MFSRHIKHIVIFIQSQTPVSSHQSSNNNNPFKIPSFSTPPFLDISSLNPPPSLSLSPITLSHTPLTPPSSLNQLKTMSSSPIRDTPQATIPDDPTPENADLPLPLSASIVLTSLPTDAASALEKADGVGGVPEKGSLDDFLMVVLWFF